MSKLQQLAKEYPDIPPYIFRRLCHADFTRADRVWGKLFKIFLQLYSASPNPPGITEIEYVLKVYGYDYFKDLSKYKYPQLNQYKDMREFCDDVMVDKENPIVLQDEPWIVRKVNSNYATAKYAPYDDCEWCTSRNPSRDYDTNYSDGDIYILLRNWELHSQLFIDEDKRYLNWLFTGFDVIDDPEAYFSGEGQVVMNYFKDNDLLPDEIRSEDYLDMLNAEESQVVESKLQEMAQPTEDETEAYWYHGTPKEEFAKGIWENGLQPNQLDNSKYKDKIHQTMKDHVYLTTNLHTALASAMQGEGNDIPFILEFNGQDLYDIFPDEDEFGKYMEEYFIHPEALKERNWLENYRTALEVSPSEWLSNEGIDADWRQLYPTLLDGLQHTWFDYQVACAKLIIPQLTPDEIYTVLANGYHNLAHKGALHPVSCHRLSASYSVNYFSMDWEQIRENSVLVASGNSSFQEALTIELDGEIYIYDYVDKIRHFDTLYVQDLVQFNKDINNEPYIVNQTFDLRDETISNLVGMPISATSIEIRSCHNLESLQGITPNVEKNIVISDVPKLKSLDGITVPTRKGMIKVWESGIPEEDFQGYSDKLGVKISSTINVYSPKP